MGCQEIPKYELPHQKIQTPSTDTGQARGKLQPNCARIQLREHIFQLVNILEIKWQQHTSSIQWLKLGDRNNPYFHTIATARKKSNTISMLNLA
jgi:hypothetical protein